MTYLKRKKALLTARQIEIHKCLCEGLSSKQIAARLNIAKNTVDNHRKNMLARLGAKNTAELTAKKPG